MPLRDSRSCCCGASPPGFARAELNFQRVLLDNSYFAYERDVGDIDGDGDNDVVAIQEGDTTLQVFRAPSWARSTLITFTGTFRYPRADDFKLADMDGDGDVDVVTRLGNAPSRDTAGIAVWSENLGRFTERRVGEGRESHLGGRLVDLDNDGDLDLVSIAYVVGAQRLHAIAAVELLLPGLSMTGTYFASTDVECGIIACASV